MQENQATWEAQLPALRTDIDALQEEQLDKQALIDAIREDLQEKVQEGMDAWEADRIALRTDIDALQKDRLDKQELVQEIREDLKQRVQKDMDAWEAQRIFLNQEITELKETMTEASSGKQARIDELAASMISKHDLDAIKEELLATISREIPGAAARVIREEIAALMK
jgi:gas vesicle protein